MLAQIPGRESKSKKYFLELRDGFDEFVHYVFKQQEASKKNVTPLINTYYGVVVPSDHRK